MWFSRYLHRCSVPVWTSHERERHLYKATILAVLSHFIFRRQPCNMSRIEKEAEKSKKVHWITLRITSRTLEEAESYYDKFTDFCPVLPFFFWSGEDEKTDTCKSHILCARQSNIDVELVLWAFYYEHQCNKVFGPPGDGPVKVWSPGGLVLYLEKKYEGTLRMRLMKITQLPRVQKSSPPRAQRPSECGSSQPSSPAIVSLKPSTLGVTKRKGIPNSWASMDNGKLPKRANYTSKV